MCNVANRTELKVQGKFIVMGTVILIGLLIAMLFLLASTSRLRPTHTPVILNIY
jgi:hypothetical protein